MRILAGQFRGRSLDTLADRSVRPTTGRAKQTIFDILSNRLVFEETEALDLFAGSGSLGLEALSRGAQRATFVDKNRTSLRVLQDNIVRLGCEDRCTLYQADVFWFLRNTRKSFGLVFIDPPYRLEHIAQLPRALYNSGAVRERTTVVMEHSRETELDFHETAYDILRRPIGQTIVLIMHVLKSS